MLHRLPSYVRWSGRYRRIGNDGRRSYTPPFTRSSATLGSGQARRDGPACQQLLFPQERDAAAGLHAETEFSGRRSEPRPLRRVMVCFQFLSLHRTLIKIGPDPLRRGSCRSFRCGQVIMLSYERSALQGHVDRKTSPHGNLRRRAANRTALGFLARIRRQDRTAGQYQSVIHDKSM